MCEDKIRKHPTLNLEEFVMVVPEQEFEGGGDGSATGDYCLQDEPRLACHPLCVFPLGL